VRSVCLALAALFLTATGCGQPSSTTPAPPARITPALPIAPSTPGPPVPLKSFVLHDVQGFFGGQSLWVCEDRTAFVQVVRVPPPGQSGLWEKRYKTTLTPEQWAEMERLVGAHQLLTARMPDRPGIPDESHPIIAFDTRAGETVRLGKWAGDKHPGFDPVYAYLLGLCKPTGELIHEGEFVGGWKPDGCVTPWK
jgi:hypothetical protein